VAYIGHASLPVTPPILRRKQHPVSVSTYIYLTRIRSHQSSIAVSFPPPTWRPTRPWDLRACYRCRSGRRPVPIWNEM